MVRGVAGGWQDLDRPVAEIERRLPRRPIGDPEERGHRVSADPGERARREIRELTVARPMVAVAVRVADDQPRKCTVPRSPRRDDLVHGVPEREEVRVRGRAGVVQQHRVLAEQQVQERRLVVDALALAEDVRVLVEGDDLDGRVGRRPQSAAPWIHRTADRSVGDTVSGYRSVGGVSATALAGPRRPRDPSARSIPGRPRGPR